MSTDVDEQQYGVSRLIAFSDGVFGFAATLLITTIPFSLGGLPPSASNQQTLSTLLSLLPNFYAYVLSFYLIGIYWVAHHRMFRNVIKYNNPLLWLNLTLLLCIAFLPVPTSFLGRYGANAVITAFYSAAQTLTCLIYLILEWYVAAHHRLIVPTLDQKTIAIGRLRSLIAFSIFALSIGIAFLNPLLARLLWLTVLVARPVALPIATSRYKREGP